MVGDVCRKLERAKFHADDFNQVWRDFVHSGVYAYTIENEGAPAFTIHFRWKVRSWTPEATHRFQNLSLIFGDLLSNLRATLDYLVWQLVLVAGGTPTDQHAFPCLTDRSKWPSASGRRLGGMDARWRNEIEGVQPYHKRDPEHDLLAVLDQVNNVNKHRALPATIVTAEQFSFPVKLPPATRVDFNSWLDRPMEDGVEFFRLALTPPVPELELGLDVDPPLRVAFSDGLDHSDGWSYTNADLVRHVEQVVAIFEPAFSS
ncbi:MAG TPA: hypothetical protein VEH29_03550 [Acidimicrobiales bacterium]|nr:hypothetical protein [Acidimicrobiales bacterium]